MLVGHVHPAQGPGRAGDPGHRPRRDLRAVPLPTGLPGPGAATRWPKFRDVNCREIARRRSADRVDHLPRRLPEAGARRHQPGRPATPWPTCTSTDPAPALDRGAGRCDEVTRLLACGPAARRSASAVDRVPRARADPDRARRGAASSVLAEALVPRASRFSAQVAITLAGLVAALVDGRRCCTAPRSTTAAGALSVDGVGSVPAGLDPAAGDAVGAADRRAQRRRRQPDRRVRGGRRRLARRPRPVAERPGPDRGLPARAVRGLRAC